MGHQKHTPGPWLARREPIRYVYVVGQPSGGHYVARCDSEEDALLIATAPELLDMLDSIVNSVVPDSPECFPMIDRARALVAKAKGNV